MAKVMNEKMFQARFEVIQSCNFRLRNWIWNCDSNSNQVADFDYPLYHTTSECPSATLLLKFRYLGEDVKLKLMWKSSCKISKNKQMYSTTEALLYWSSCGRQHMFYRVSLEHWQRALMRRCRSLTIVNPTTCSSVRLLPLEEVCALRLQYSQFVKTQK
jgi:hypothetical protein